MAHSEQMTTMKVPSWFKDWVKAHKHDDETMFEAWQRLSGGPDPREVTGILSDEQAAEMLERIDAKSSNETRRKLREEFDDS